MGVGGLARPTPEAYRKKGIPYVDNPPATLQRGNKLLAAPRGLGEFGYVADSETEGGQIPAASTQSVDLAEFQRAAIRTGYRPSWRYRDCGGYLFGHVD